MATAFLRAESAPAYPMNLPPRAAIEAAVETLLSVLDTLDGDPDLEDDDPAGDALDKGELDEGCDLAPPIYGVDQTKGPLNETEAYRSYLARLRS